MAGAACSFPLIAKRFPRLRIPPSFLFFARHFGTGVLIATAFAHLLPTAFLSLTDPCLPPVWNEQYPAMAGAFAMAAIFLVTLVEMVFTKGICAGHYSPTDHAHARLESGRLPPAAASEDAVGGAGGLGRFGFGIAGRRRSRGHSIGQELQRFSSEMEAVAPAVAVPPAAAAAAGLGKAQGEEEQGRRGGGGGGGGGGCGGGCGGGGRGAAEGRGSVDCVRSVDCLRSVGGGSQEQAPPGKADGSVTSASAAPSFDKLELTPAQEHKRALLQCFLLEMGILFHSLFIGMAVSVTTGPGFVVLLIAICFHQTFEGLALGARIAALHWDRAALQPWLMALAYGLTTPVGQALGLATHTLYDPQSVVGLLVVGIMNAISSGLLVFAGLVELLAEDFLSDESWRSLVGRERHLACFYVLAGAFGMSLVGAWA